VLLSIHLVEEFTGPEISVNILDMKRKSHHAVVSSVQRVVSTQMPTKWGAFLALAFERVISNGTQHIETALALILGDLTEGAPLLRIHSQCFTGEVLGSLRCDCRDQLDIAMQMIAEEGRGLVIYEHQEGRGIGLMAKLQAYALQDAGLDTVEANHALGFKADCRDFSMPAAILQNLGINRVRLLTNNPHKSRALSDAGILVLAEIPCEAAPTRHSLAYLQTKKDKMGHTLSLGGDGRASFSPGQTTTLPLLRRGGEDRGLSRHSVLATADKGETGEQFSPTNHPGAPSEDQFEFASIEVAIREFRAGRMIVVIDDEDRENEGDLTMAAEMITPEAINFMATHGRGLICLAMTGERLDELELPAMVPDNTSLGGTAFTVSIDLRGAGVTTGISAHDRAQTIRAAIDARSHPEDFGRPGHIFPLRARAGGVLERRGQTEAAVDLASLAGLYPAGVICEIVNDDGTMARVPDLIRFCKKHDLVMITVAELARYRFDLDDEGALVGSLVSI
jgi:3,4-dihydroxy-2-butanone 4-phosphate synthase/GTP cyclohydrolase II